MDKEDLDVGGIFTHITTDTLETLRGEAQAQTFSALFLTVVGLILTLAGFVAVLLKLVRLVNCNILLLVQRLGVVRRVTMQAGKGKLQKNRTYHHYLPPIHQSDNLSHQKPGYISRTFSLRKTKAL